MVTFADFNIYVDPNGSEEQTRVCPQCSSQRKKKNTKCLSINVKKEVWLCHHCGWSGSLSKGSQWSEPAWIKPEYKKPQALKHVDLPPAAIKFFKDRGIGTKTIKDNKISLENVYIPQVEEWQDAITYPYFSNGIHINNKYRAPDKNFRMVAQARLSLYGLDDIGDSEVVIWVEGEMDKLSLWEAGIKHCVSVPNGAPPPDSKSYSAKFEFLDGAEKALDKPKHILWFDNDAAGMRLEEEISRRLGQHRCKRVQAPKGLKDANEVLIDLGVSGVKNCIEHAQDFPVSGIHTAAQLQDKLMLLHEKGLEGGYATGWLAVDNFYTVALGQMTIVTGIPNHGKSNWLDNLLVNLALNHGLRFGLFSPENQPLERHAANLVEKASKTSFKTLLKQDVDSTNYWVNEHFYWILPSIDDSWTLDSLLDKAKTLVTRHGINGLVLDPWNEIEHIRPKGLSETEYISQALTKIRQFARLYNVHVWVVAHPTKLQKDQKTGEYPPPTPYDISGSSNWRNKADNCITVYRQSPKRVGKPCYTVDIYIMKVRFKEVGQVGQTALRYDPNNSCYYEQSAGIDI